MINDTVPYIGVMKDSVLLQDTVYIHRFSLNPVEGEIVNMINKQLYSAHQDSIGDVVRYSGDLLPFNLEQVDGIFCLLLLCLFLFTYIYSGGLSFLKESISFLFTPVKASRIHSQTTSREMIYSYFLIFQSAVLSAICIYDVFVEYESSVQSNSKAFLTIVTFIVAIALFFGIKDFIYKLIGYIFNQKKAMNSWRRMHMVSIEVLGILYFLPTLLLIYSNFYHTEILILILILFLIVQITLFYQIIVFFIGQKFNFLYLIAYLCTFEILPYVYLAIGLIQLYRTDVFNTLL